MNLLAAIVPLLAFVHADSGAESVRICLFTLFKPEAVEVRVASGDGASLVAEGAAGASSLNRGEVILIRLSSGKLHLQFAGRTLLATEARIIPIGSRTLNLSLPGRINRDVRGELRVDAGPGGRGHLRIVLITDREAAVASVVAAESIGRQPEALKALAIVVRTFMLSHEGRHSSEGFDFCDTTHCQLYRGEQDITHVDSAAVEKAVIATSEQFLEFEGQPVEGYYTASCGGMTVTPSMLWGGNTSYPYRCVQCRWCKGSQFAKWERSAGAARLLNALSQFIGTRLSLSTQLTMERDLPSGFVRSITIADGTTRTTLTADAFRRAVGLKLGWNTVLSATFTLERRGQRFIFRGRGFGSQIGMCEAGAMAQAAAGRTYREILEFYYPASEIHAQK